MSRPRRTTYVHLHTTALTSLAAFLTRLALKLNGARS